MTSDRGRVFSAVKKGHRGASNGETEDAAPVVIKQDTTALGKTICDSAECGMFDEKRENVIRRNSCRSILLNQAIQGR
jgi:hypothetical protein